MPRDRYSNLLSRYRRYAPEYDQQYARYTAGTLGKAVSLLPESARTLLDVACGTGALAAAVRERGCEMAITGIDISPDMLERARERFKHEDGVDFRTGTAEHLPVDDRAFDALTCNNAFHLVQDAAAALREFHRVLKPGGRAVIVDWCRDAPQMKAMAIGLKLTDRQVRRIRTLDGLTSLLQEHGFSVMHAERFRVPPLWGLMAVAAERA